MVAADAQIPSAPRLLRWVGCKARISSWIAGHLPPRMRVYCEPFAGSAAVGLDLLAAGRCDVAILGDLNDEVATFHRVVRDAPRELEEAMRETRWISDRSCYDYVRDLDPWSLPQLTRAARFLYLNRLSFNGLYRVNRSGGFNAPPGDRLGGPVCADLDELVRASAILERAIVWSGDYRSTIRAALALDDRCVCYLDPPYDEAFDAYTPQGWSRGDTEDLAGEIVRLTNARARVAVSNASTALTRTVLGWGQTSSVALRHRVGARRGGGAKLVREMLVLNYDSRYRARPEWARRPWQGRFWP